jgi:hypothetical protein
VVGAVASIADPLSAFARALGGHGVDAGRAVAVDGDGNTYVAGDTSSADFPVTPGGRPQRAGAATSAFVAKLDPAGRVVYTTLLGGRGFTAARAIAVDGAGRVYVTGATNATDYPTTRFALQRSYGGGPFDAFVTALDRSGHLAYSTFLGDTHYDEGNAIAVDRRGRAVVTGRTVSAHFPRARALRPPVGGGAFVTKLSRAGSSLVFSAVLGGDDKANRGDTGFGVAVDRAGATYVTGVTNAPAFPTVHALQPRLRGAGDAFVAKIDAAGRSVVYSTYLGGGGDDSARAVATDEAGNAYVAGVTTSHDLPTRHALQTANAGGADAFVTKLDPRGRALVYSTYLGASGDDSAYAIAVGDRGRAYVTGHTASSDLPAAAVGGGAGGAFVRRLSRSGASLTYSATIAGAGASGLGIAADRLGAIAVTGLTSDRGGDAFVTAVAPSTADFLRRQLVPRGASARILALLARGGARVRFALPAAGRVRVSWYAGRVLVARGRSSFAKAGTRTIDVRLDAAGRLRLATRRAARLTAAVVFTAADRSPVSAKAAFTLRR